MKDYPWHQYSDSNSIWITHIQGIGWFAHNVNKGYTNPFKNYSRLSEEIINQEYKDGNYLYTNETFGEAQKKLAWA